jgi:EAL domain-containing protein (putative c-di-GMP-specific phosphodiesterase class I)
MKNSFAVRETLQALKDLGLHLSVDDFGTGYSSLSYLRQLPLNVLKVDRSFVRDLGEDRSSREVVRAMIQMAHALGLEVIAEGVETAAQWECLANLGCDGVQGHLVSPALPLPELEAMIESPASTGRLDGIASCSSLRAVATPPAASRLLRASGGRGGRRRSG